MLMTMDPEEAVVQGRSEVEGALEDMTVEVGVDRLVVEGDWGAYHHFLGAHRS